MYLFLCLKVGSASMEKVALILLLLMLRLPVYHICCSKTYIPLLRDFSKIIPSFFTIKEVIFFESLRLPLAKGSSTFLTKPLFPQGREDVTALRCSEPLRSKVGGPSKVYARLCGMGPPKSLPFILFLLIFLILSSLS